jgi:outer membrane protein
MGIHTQNVWTLKDCIRTAVEKNIQIKQALIQEMRSQNNFNQSKNNLLPSVSADLGGGMSIGNSLNPTTYQVQFRNAFTSNIGIGAQMTLFQGGQQLQNIEVNKNLYLAASKDKETYINNLALTAANLYLLIVQSQEILRTANTQNLTTKDQAQRTQKLIDAGVLPKGNMLDIEAQMSREELNIMKASNSLDLATFQLKQLLLLTSKDNINFDTVFQIESMKYSELEIENITTDAIEKLPQIQSEVYRYNASLHQINIAKGAFLPTLSFSYYAGSNFINTSNDFKDSSIMIPSTPIAEVFNPFDNKYYTINSLQSQRDIKVADGERPYFYQLKDNLSHRLNLSLNIPIFAKYQRKTNLTNAMLQAKNQELVLEQSKNKVKEEIYTAYLNYINAEKSLGASTRAEVAYKNALDLAKEKFDAGVVNSLDFNTATNNYQVAQSDQTRAKFEYFFRNIVLDIYAGKGNYLSSESTIK